MDYLPTRPASWVGSLCPAETGTILILMLCCHGLEAIHTLLRQGIRQLHFAQRVMQPFPPTGARPGVLRAHGWFLDSRSLPPSPALTWERAPSLSDDGEWETRCLALLPDSFVPLARVPDWSLTILFLSHHVPIKNIDISTVSGLNLALSTDSNLVLPSD